MAQEDLIAIADDLGALRDATRKRMNETVDKEESDRLFLQILEITHRLQMIDAIFFKAGTEALTEHVEKIDEATEQARDALRSIEHLADAIAGIKSLLGLVDTVIDIVA